MSEPLSTLALRLPLRALRTALTVTRELTERALDAVDLIADVLSSVDPEPAREDVAAGARDVRDGPRREPPGPDPADVVVVDFDAGEPVAPAHVTVEAEIVEEVAEPGAQDGAGAQVTIDEPFAGYDALRAADVVARVRGADAATLAAIELYELSHRKRRTVLEAIAREARRPRGR